MATAMDIMKRSMRMIGAIGSNETLDDDEAQDALVALNTMLDEWSTRNLFIYSINDRELAWPSGQSSQTIGSGGDFDETRPIDIHYAWQRINNVDYPIRVLDDLEFYGIGSKTVSSDVALGLYYEKDFPLGIIHLYPTPSASIALRLAEPNPLQYFDSLTEALAMPPGYQNAITYNLALELAPEYQRSVPDHVVRRASASLRAIRTVNHRQRNLTVETAYFDKSRSGSLSVLTGL